ncbi:MAG TPA: alkyl sulfatase C-terminal domain-containing protein [Jatrophihabitantaceae bacterium]|jgi:alkyl sulfatase BDS1-like metallo-beta-lactamase superfamily hydrolase
MATVDDCERAMHALADRLAGVDPEKRSRSDLDRSLSCTLPDIEAIFAGRLKDGLLTDIRRVDTSDAQIKLTMSSDDLVQLVDGRLHLASAWASGRIKIGAGMVDLLKLRSIF